MRFPLLIISFIILFRPKQNVCVRDLLAQTITLLSTSIFVKEAIVGCTVAAHGLTPVPTISSSKILGTYILKSIAPLPHLYIREILILTLNLIKSYFFQQNSLPNFCFCRVQLFCFELDG